MRLISFIFSIIFITIIPISIYAQDKSVMRITYHSQQSEKDKRFEYDISLLKIALEKTKEKYGEYTLTPLEIQINYKRIEQLSLYGNIENLFYKHSVTEERLKKHGYIPFPVDLGIVGFRIGFIPKNMKDEIAAIKTIDELKKYTILQGIGWLDIKILEKQGFNVVSGSNYNNLFKMIAFNRGDIFLRGANELYDEWNAHKDTENLDFDNSIAIYYPLPRFFFTSKKNKKALKRIKEGLDLAYKDGSLLKLWEKHYSKSISFVNLHKRKIFKLENPFIKNIDKEYEKYIYKP